MNIYKVTLLSYLILLLFSGCASHAPVLPQTPKKGEINTGFTFSVENVIPVIWWRYGINKYTDIGYRLGIPLSGSGIDFNRILMKKEYSWDVLNTSYNFSPNSSFDFTYYKFKGYKRKGQYSPFHIKWYAARAMIIPNGRYKERPDNDNQSIRFGVLFGRRFGQRWGVETGYFHDLKAGFDSKNDEYPHKYKNWPTQFSKGAGLSLQVFLYMGPKRDK
tara:strand:- start:161 stop:814 length:654 start_codon:yes stop_codon:yes gene_type:complete